MLKKDENNVAKFIEENEQNMNNAIDGDIQFFETEDNIDIDNTNINIIKFKCYEFVCRKF